MRVGILGAGGMGKVHGRQYRKMPDVELQFFDPMTDRAEAFTALYDCSCAESVETLIKWADVVDVCLPSDMHHEFALKGIANGKAIFVEKPLAKSLEQGTEMIEAARKANVPLMTGQVVRFFAEFAEGHRLVMDGHIGNPAAARTRRGGLAPRGGLGDWFMDHHRSGGVMIDLAVHDFDWLRWTLGEVKTVFSQSLGAKTMQGPDYALTIMTHESGAVSHVEATWMDPSGFRTAYEVCGSEGMIQYDSRQMASLKTTTGPASVFESPLFPTDDPYFRQLSGFLDAVRDNRRPPVTGEDGWMALSIALAALESAKTGKPISPARI